MDGLPASRRIHNSSVSTEPLRSGAVGLYLQVVKVLRMVLSMLFDRQFVYEFFFPYLGEMLLTARNGDSAERTRLFLTGLNLC